MASADFSRIPSFYHNYIRQVGETELPAALDQHQKELVAVLESLPESAWDFRYAEGKWTVRELVQHIIDAERIFGYRALRFARNDSTELPGFDENLFAENAEAEKRSAADLLEEIRTLQRSSAQLFHSFTRQQLDRTGKANGHPVYVEGIGFIIVGHARHHLNVLRERYLAVQNF